MQNEYDVVVIGGGIVGANIIYELSQYDLKTIILEKNIVFVDETSKSNSGVIHGGFDPDPRKIEARLNVLGNNLWVTKIMPQIAFPWKKIDSFVIAFNAEEMDEVKKLYQQGLVNGVRAEDLQILSQQELLALAPEINAIAVGALLCTSSYVIDPVRAGLALIAAAQENAACAQADATVTEIYFKNGQFQITINNQTIIYAKNIINAAGHHADLIAAMAGYPDFQQTTRRGEYRVLDRSEAKKVHGIYFKVPTIHGKGVIVAPMLDGKVLVGPTAEEGVAKSDVSLVTQEKYNLIGQIGRDIIPSLNLDRTTAVFAGSRPIDIASNDFVIGYAKNNKHFINVAGMQSPGLSSAPAIALEVIKLLKGNGVKLTYKTK